MTRRQKWMLVMTVALLTIGWAAKVWRAHHEQKPVEMQTER